MLFCTQCGNPIAEDMSFCTNCGASAEGSQSANSISEQVSYTAIADQPQQYLSQQPYQAYTPIESERRKQTQALVAVFAALTITTMLLSWFSLHVSLPQALLDEIQSTASYSEIPLPNINNLEDGIIIKITMFELDRIIGGIHNTVNFFVDLGNYESSLLQLEGVADTLKTALIAVNVIKFAVILAVFTLFLSIYMLITEKKAAALIGQIGGTIAFVIALIFAISMKVLNSSISEALVDLEAPYYIGDMLKVSCSIWVYATMVLGILIVFLIGARKKTIQGK